MSQKGSTIRYKRPKSNPKTWAWAYGLIAPTIIGLCVLNIYPFFYTIYLSLLKYKGLGKPKYVGLANYAALLKDPKLGQFTWNTLYFVILTVPVGIFIALILAALLNNKIRGRDIYRGNLLFADGRCARGGCDGLEMDIQFGQWRSESGALEDWHSGPDMAFQSEYRAFILRDYQTYGAQSAMIWS